MPQSATVTTGTRTDTVEPGQPIKRGANRVTTADQDAARISVDLFGGLRVRAGGRLIGPRELGGTKPRHVLLALLLHRGAPVSKDRLISVLWGASPPSCATATLEGYVCVLRKKLQPAQTVRASLISTVAGHYAIDMGRVDLDLVRYEHLVSAALDPATSPADALPMLQQAMSLAESPLLPEEIDSASGPPVTALGSAISDEVSDEISHNTSLEQAFRSLNLLLRSVRGPRSNLAGAA